jgi:hypothetical protein
MRAVQATGPAARVVGATGPLLRPRTYYASPRGNDLNPGTRTLPLRTIQAGINKAEAGDTVMVLGGTYREQVTFPRSGAEGLPITVRGQVDGLGNPLAIIDNTSPVGATWTAAPDKGSGIYKKVGFSPGLMLWNGNMLFKLNAPHMAGESDTEMPSGFTILNCPPDTAWTPYGPVTTPLWDDVECIYGVLNGDTTYIRFRNGDDPDTCDLRAAATIAYPGACGFSLSGSDYITIEHMRIQGSNIGVRLSDSDHNIIQDCVIRHGHGRILVDNGSADNTIRRNDLSFGYGDFGHFGEWGMHQAVIRRAAMYKISKQWDGHGVSTDWGTVLENCGKGNVIDSNVMHDGSTAINLYCSPNTSIRGNDIARFSSCGIVINAGTDSLTVCSNDLDHCNSTMRFSGVRSDSGRLGWIYSNRCYNDSAALEAQNINMSYYGVEGDSTNALEFWFYHNSFAGGGMWSPSILGVCSQMKWVNNIMSVQELSAGEPQGESTASTYAAFDCNFLGGRYKGYRHFKFAQTDGHNQWSEDTLAGDINHQVWSLGSEPNWDVPGTSTACRTGLDLSDSFTIRGIKYGPLPGMTPGYFPGAKPNLGAVQNMSPLGTPDRSSGHGSVTRLPELTFAPNPATEKHAMVRCAIAAGTVGRLALRDVLGRTVMSVALLPPDTTPQVDLRGFAPGVYFASLRTPEHCVSHKLVITSR